MASTTTRRICRSSLCVCGLDFLQGFPVWTCGCPLIQVPSRPHTSSFKRLCCLLRNVSQLERLTSPIHTEPFDGLWMSCSNSPTWLSSDVKLRRLNLIFSSTFEGGHWAYVKASLSTVARNLPDNVSSAFEAQ